MTDQFHRRQMKGITNRAQTAAEDADGTLTVVIERSARPDERLKFEPRGRPGPDYWQVEQVRKKGSWRTRGKEAVNGITVEDERI